MAGLRRSIEVAAGPGPWGWRLHVAWTQSSWAERFPALRMGELSPPMFRHTDGISAALAPYLPSLLLQQRAAAGRRRGRTPGSRRPKPKDLQTPRGSKQSLTHPTIKNTRMVKPIGEEINRELLPVPHSLSILIGVFLGWSRVSDKTLNRLVHPDSAAVHLLSL